MNMLKYSFMFVLLAVSSLMLAGCIQEDVYYGGVGGGPRGYCAPCQDRYVVSVNRRHHYRDYSEIYTSPNRHHRREYSKEYASPNSYSREYSKEYASPNRRDSDYSKEYASPNRPSGDSREYASPRASDYAPAQPE